MAGTWQHGCLLKECMILRTLPFLMSIPVLFAAAGQPVLWVEPTDLTSRDLFYGSGGKEHDPKGPFTFLKEDLDGTNAKFEVKDPDGVKWKVKLGAETGPETVASRLVWAVGYFTNEDYFLRDIAVIGLPGKLKRGQSLRLAGDKFDNVRLKRSEKGTKGEGYWKWKDNPFVKTREMNGLRTLMAVLNNWDLKDVNNSIIPRQDGSDIYLVKDLGASFGTDHLVRSHDVAKGNTESYRDSRFIVKKNTQTVDFATPGRPSLAFAINPHETFSRTSMQWIGDDIPVEDARWMGGLLGQLSATQIREAFRAGGYGPEFTEAFAKVLEQRIADLKAL